MEFMLKSLDALEDGFRKVSEKSQKECGAKLEEIRKLTFVSGLFVGIVHAYFKTNEEGMERWGNSLHHACLLELFRISGHTVFLSCYGLYRNAFDNIRHALETIVQAIYIDHRHPETSLTTKIEILKEVEEKREYHAIRLIDELDIHYKDRLKKEYKRLSKIIHPSHEQIVRLLEDIKTDESGIPTPVSCEQISRIYDSMKIMYDIYFFLILNHLPELKKAIKENSNIVKALKKYEFSLLNRQLKI
jgi:hypothetical protein